MAVMRTEQKVIDGLGPVGMVREAFKLFSTYFKFFMMVQLTLLLPLAILTTLATEYVIYRITPEQTRLPMSRAAGMPNLPSNFGVSFPAGAAGLQLGLAVVAMLLIWAVATTVGVALASLSTSTIIYALGLHYTGQSVSFQNVLRTAIPRLWMRMTITKICKVLLVYVMLMAQLGGSLLLMRYASRGLMLLGGAAFGLLSAVGLVCLELIFIVAGGVAVLEKDYGWAAVRKALKLLKGRVMIALLYQLLLLVPTVFLIGLQRVFRYQITKGDYSPGSLIASLIITVVYISCVSLLWQMKGLCAGVQYVSFKAYHNEDLAESVFEKQAMKAGYERIESGAGDAKSGGLGAESLV